MSAMRAIIKPFIISIPDEKLTRLQQKLRLTDFPDECVDAENWCHGSPLADVKRLTHHWIHTFDWRAAEARLNTFPQYTTEVEIAGFGRHEVHFIHQPSAVRHAIPLLFVHGWPGSFIEVTRMLPALVAGSPAFHVVAPSLIDFGFSSASGAKTFNIAQQAEALHQVMLALGYSEYVVQGGDLGYLIARFLAQRYGPGQVKAHHLNNTAPAEPTADSHADLHARIQRTPLSAAELAGLNRTQWFSQEGNGYLRKQSTRPQTVGYFFADSPVGLLAWLLEPLHDWIDPSSSRSWSDDDILTWTSIYYFSRAGPAASNYIYYAIEHAGGPADTSQSQSPFTIAQRFCPVPLGISRFPYDLIVLPKLWNQTLGPVVFEQDHDRGGHFAAWENPEALVADLRRMFGKQGGAFGVVAGKSGYDD